MRMKRILLLILYGLLVFAPTSMAARRVWATEAFGGVGVLLDFDPQDPKSVLIFSVTYKSPADKARIRRGERLLKIDGVEVTGLTLPQLSEKIRGPLGSQVTLTVQGSDGAARDVPLVRDAIKGGPVVAMPPPNMASTGVFFSAEEKEIIKKKIVSLTTDEQREKMLNLLKALKAKQITKTQFMGFLKSDF